MLVFTSPNPKHMYIFGQITSCDLTPNGVLVKSKGNHLISGKSRLVNYLNLATYIWNPNDHCFEWKGPSFEGFKAQNRGHTGSRYIYIYTYIYPNWDSTKFYVYISTKKNPTNKTFPQCPMGSCVGLFGVLGSKVSWDDVG